MSKCSKDENGYHNPIQFHDYPDAVVEGCTLCNKKLIYRKHEGKINQAEYYNDHIRDFAQPFGSTAKIFEKIYGARGRRVVRESIRFNRGRKTPDQKQQEWEDTLKEAKKDMRKMDEYGKFTTTSGL